MAVAVVVGISLSGVRHAHLVPDMLRAKHGARGKILSDNFVWRLRCVNLSGGFARWGLWHRRCNGVYLTPNGMLVKPDKRREMASVATNVLACVHALSRTPCRVLYVQMPNKQSLDGRGFPVSFGENFANANGDEMLSLLRAEMRTVDLRPVLAATAEDVSENFIRTDHHWNFAGAFKAFQVLFPVLVEEGGVTTDVVLPQLDRASWDWVGIPRRGARFLGTRARRTGTWFVGYDRLFYLVPKFKTDLAVATVDQKGVTRRVHGDFVATIINWQDLREPPTYVEDYAYNVYLGDMAYVEIDNESAPVARTVFVIKNSMGQPLVAWLATVFTKVIAVDPRYHRGTMLADVREARPDVVVIAAQTCRQDYFQ